MPAENTASTMCEALLFCKPTMPSFLDEHAPHAGHSKCTYGGMVMVLPLLFQAVPVTMHPLKSSLQSTSTHQHSTAAVARRASVHCQPSGYCLTV
jgi:hypothetical protein